MHQTSAPNDSRIVIALNRDVFFGVKLSHLARELGFDLKLVPNAAGVAESLAAEHGRTALVIVDMNVLDMGIDWPALQETLAAYPDVPSLGFGSHTDVEVRRDAKKAGLSRIVSNGEFHRDAATLIQRYARAINGQ